MTRHLTNSELEAYLDEALCPADMADVEKALRDKPALAERLIAINTRRDAGIHTLGEIWRRHRLSCPTRSQLGSFLLGAVGEEEARYIRFHVELIGCRLCIANVEDLRVQQAEGGDVADQRRRKYFQSSAGYLKRRK